MLSYLARMMPLRVSMITIQIKGYHASPDSSGRIMSGLQSQTASC